MPRPLVALSLAAALALTPIPVRADTHSDSTQQHEAIGALLFGLTALAVIGAIASAQEDEKDPPRTHVPPATRHPPQARTGQRHVDRYALPLRCLNRIHTVHGTLRLFTRYCMERAYPPIHTLPRACYHEVRQTDGRMRFGWQPRCLQRMGYYGVRHH